MTSDDIETLIVQPEEVDLRIDKLLSTRLPEQSRTYFQYLIEKGLVLVNGNPVKKREKLKSGDEIEIEYALTPELSLEPENIPLDIIFEDEHLLVVNKPAGLVVHPAVGHWSHTFVNALLYHCKHLQGSSNLRPGIVHRLDKDTSGLLVAAKTELAHQKLVALFASRAIEKEYLAICFGSIKECVIESRIGRHPVRRKEMCEVEVGGKVAITRCYPVAALSKEVSLVQLILETGRTHQIRVHLKARGVPILGDALYGSTSVNKKMGVKRQFLHAYRLSFKHPITNESLFFEAKIPGDMTHFIQKLHPEPINISPKILL